MTQDVYQETHPSLRILVLPSRKMDLLCKHYLLFPARIERNQAQTSTADSLFNNHLLKHPTPCNAKHNKQDNSTLIVSSTYQYITPNADNCLMKLRQWAASVSHISSNSATIPVKWQKNPAPYQCWGGAGLLKFGRSRLQIMLNGLKIRSFVPLAL